MDEAFLELHETSLLESFKNSAETSELKEAMRARKETVNQLGKESSSDFEEESKRNTERHRLQGKYYKEKGSVINTSGRIYERSYSNWSINKVQIIEIRLEKQGFYSELFNFHISWS